MIINRWPLRWIIGLALLLAGFRVQAFAVAENDNASIEAIGAMRLTGAYFHYPDVPCVFPENDDGLGAGEFRIILDGNLGQVDYDVNFWADLSRVPQSLTWGAFDTAGSYSSPYRTTYLSWTYWDDGPINGQLGLDYFSVYYEAAPVDLTVGRFPVNYSVTNIFTPNDFFVPFSASAINKIYKPGVDAIRLGIAAGPFTNVEIVGVMGNDEEDVPSWAQSALLVRSSTVFLNIEWAVLGGKLAERWFVGASLQGEAGPLGIRAEGHAGFPDKDGDGTLNEDDQPSDIFGRFSVGLEALFPWQNAMIGLEYAFYSDGANSADDYVERISKFMPDDQIFLAQHYLGLLLGCDIVPILRASAMVIFNAIDYSGFSSATLIYNITDEADFVGGVMVPWGKRPTVTIPSSADPEEDPCDTAPPPELESEFGLMSFTVFLETRFYF